MINILDAAEPVLKLQANRSASWRQTKWLILFLVGPSLIMATVWFFLGAWVILPVAGFEAIIFACLLYRVSCNTYQWQQITKKQDSLLIEAGRLKAQQRLQFDLCSTYLAKQQRIDGSLEKITLTSPDQCFEVGAFLHSDERKQLLKTLLQWGLKTYSVRPEDTHQLAC